MRSFVDAGNNGLDRVIPRDVLERAAGFAIFTVVKAGFLFSARAGSGIVIAKLEDGASWSAPSAIGTGGVGFGGQAGAEVTDFLIVLNTRQAVKTFMAAGSLTLGGNLSVAVGPLGRNAEGSGTLSSKGKAAALYSYSKTKGLFGGVSIEGSVIVERQDANRLAYGRDVTAKQLLSGRVDREPWADDLVEVVKRCTGLPNGRDWVDDRFGFDSGRGRGYDDEMDSEVAAEKDSPGAQYATLPRSASYGGGYAFGESGVGSFSSSAGAGAGTNPGASGGGRTRSGSLASVLKRDLYGNPSSMPAGVGFPRRTSNAGSSSSTPSMSRRTSALNVFRRKEPSSGGGGGLESPTFPSEALDDDPFAEGSLARESNPFDSYDSRPPPRSPSAALHPDLDLSQEVISPWNNDRGLPSPKIRGSSPTVSPARSRSSSVNAPPPPAPLSSSNIVAGRARSGSGTASAVKFSSPLRDDSPDAGGVDALAGRMSRLRASSSASNKLHKSGARGYAPTPEEDDYDVTVTSSSSYRRPHAATIGGPRPSAALGVRKELLEGLSDGLPRGIALHEFVGEQPGDLSMRKGDVIVVTQQGKSRDEWWTGRNPLTGKEGIFP